MKTLLPLVAAAGLAAAAYSQTTSSAPGPLLHIATSFDFVVHAPYAVAAPLFGPVGERAWAGKHWDPHFLYPQHANDQEGAVFTVRHGPFNAVWVNTLFDMDARHFQYVYFMPDVMVTMIDVRFKPISADSTSVNVIYTRTAITPSGNEHVKAMSDGDKSAGQEWQQAIEKHLAASRIPMER